MQNNAFLNNIELVSTADGSKTIFNPSFGENYHSKNGALQESKHVFVNSGLKHYHQQTQKTEISILEIGFGTGLNFLLSADYAASTEIKLSYTGLEAYPLPKDIINETGYKSFVNSEAIFDEYLYNYDSCFEKRTEIIKLVDLKIENSALLSYASLEKFDIVYFDAFARVHQAEMWTEESIKHACKFLKDKGIFVTYSVTGDLKRQLKNLGFEIERPQGAAGKREMMRATLQYVL